jgi:hypothetical protein
LFIRNAYHGDLFRINDLELVIDTKNFNNKYQKYIDQTYVVEILAKNLENPDLNISSSFELTFADKNDMNSYFIGKKDEYIYEHGYGDPSFSKVVSDFYYGPDLKFNISLKTDNLTSGNSDIVLPIITKTKEVTDPQILQGNHGCYSSFFNRFMNTTSNIENIAFYCVHEHAIDRHIFDTVEQEEINWDSTEFSRYSFIDFSVVARSQSATHFNDELIVLSEKPSEKEIKYYLHFFDVVEDMVTWREMVPVELPSRYKLREKDPLIDFDNGSYFVLIDESETSLFFVSRDGHLEATKFIKNKVKDLDVYNDLLFVTHFDTNYVPVYKISSYFDKWYQREYIQVDFLNNYEFSTEIKEFNTKDTCQAVIFQNDNLIEIWEIGSPYKIEFVRALPFFMYKNDYKFYFNTRLEQIIYARFERFLYVIMINPEEIGDKKLF